MKRFIWKKRFSLPEMIGLISIAVICVSVISHAVMVPNTFVPGTVISAGEVNVNFQALVEAVTNLETRMDTVEANKALLLDPYLSVDPGPINSLSGPHVILTGANLHIRNGTGATYPAINGVGNLVVGYNEAPLSPSRGGSHNLIVGPEHNYSSYGGFVAGYENIVIGPYASVSGGELNTASALFASVSGGNLNTASGQYASVSGGYQNTASGDWSSVSGGGVSTASGLASSVSGGYSHNMISDYGWMACSCDCGDCP
jgi:hypothetical protein